jgi:hypothetical protein
MDDDWMNSSCFFIGCSLYYPPWKLVSTVRGFSHGWKVKERKAWKGHWLGFLVWNRSPLVLTFLSILHMVGSSEISFSFRSWDLRISCGLERMNVVWNSSSP